MKNKKIIISSCLALALLLGSFLFSGCLKEKGPTYSLNLEVWGVFDDSDVFYKINQAFAKNDPEVKEVVYKKVSNDPVDFERQFLDAIASGNGPDVIFFSNKWLLKHQSKLAQLPNSSQYLDSYSKSFVDVAKSDFVSDGQIYAMPLYCDTLALYYNKDIFNQNGIATLPKSWDDISRYTQQLTKIDNYGNIQQSAIAMGRSKDPGGINRSMDILMLLMMQNGSKIYDSERRQVMLARDTGAREALDFYVSFSNRNSINYTWNSKMDYSVDSFRYGRTAMMINYSYLAERLKNLDPKFNFGIAEVPQFNSQNKLNFSNYWGLAVLKNKNLIRSDGRAANYTNEQRIQNAWDYVLFVTTEMGKSGDFDATENYLEMTKKPAARRDLIEKQKSDPNLGVFASQALTAKSWSQPDDTATDDIFAQLIDDVAMGRVSSYEALKQVASRLENLYKQNQ